MGFLTNNQGIPGYTRASLTVGFLAPNSGVESQQVQTAWLGDNMLKSSVLQRVFGLIKSYKI